MTAGIPPDPAESRVVLIGTDTFESDNLSPLPRVGNNLDALSQAFADPEIFGLPDGNLAVLRNPSSHVLVHRAVQNARDAATDTLIVYLAGHGFPSRWLPGDLVLPLNGSDPAIRETLLSYRALAEDILVPAYGAPRRMIILDCCHAGLAANGPLGAGQSVVLAAVGATKDADPGTNRYTAFTEALLGLLSFGVPGPQPVLTAGAISRKLRRELRAEPYWWSSCDGLTMPIARNRAVAEAPAGPGPPASPRGRHRARVVHRAPPNRGISTVTATFGDALWDHLRAAPAGLGRPVRQLAERVIQDLRDRAVAPTVADLAAIAAAHLDDPGAGAALLQAAGVTELRNLAVEAGDAGVAWRLERRTEVTMPVRAARPPGPRLRLRAPLIVIGQRFATGDPARLRSLLATTGPLLVITGRGTVPPPGRGPHRTVGVALAGAGAVPAPIALQDLATLLGTPVLATGRELPAGFRAGQADSVTIGAGTVQVEHPVIDVAGVQTARAALTTALGNARDPAARRGAGARLRLLNTGRPVLTGPAAGDDRGIGLPAILDSAIDRNIVVDVGRTLEAARATLDLAGTAAAEVLRAALTRAARTRATNHPVLVEVLVEALRGEVVRVCDSLVGPIPR